MCESNVMCDKYVWVNWSQQLSSHGLSLHALLYLANPENALSSALIVKLHCGDSQQEECLLLSAALLPTVSNLLYEMWWHDVLTNSIKYVLFRVREPFDLWEAPLTSLNIGVNQQRPQQYYISAPAFWLVTIQNQHIYNAMLTRSNSN